MDWDDKWRLHMCTTCSLLMTSEILWPFSYMDWDGEWSVKVTYVQPVTFWWPVRYSDHSATWTEMVSDLWRLHMCTTCNLLHDDQWDTLTIPLHGLRWWVICEGYICVQPVTSCMMTSEILWPFRYMDWDGEWFVKVTYVYNQKSDDQWDVLTIELQ